MKKNQTINYLYMLLDNSLVLNINRLIGLVGKVFANGPGDLSSVSGRVIPKTLKIVLDDFLLYNQHY